MGEVQVQAVYPLVVLVVPLTVICALQLVSVSIPGGGYVCIGAVCTIPLFNSISVLVLMPSYRRLLLCRRRPVVGDSTVQKANFSRSLAAAQPSSRST